MEFSILCPNDGPVSVGLEDVASIVVRGADALDVVFACPRCGADLLVTAQVPRMLIATLQDAMVTDAVTGEQTISIEGLIERGLIPPDAVPASRGVVPSGADSEMVERYVEYFRRQLAKTASADAMLAEIDQR